MMRNIMALYDDPKTADCVVEALLDSSLMHRDILIMSGDFWKEETYDPSSPYHSPEPEVHRRRTMLKVRASGDEARLARGMICNSGALDVCEREAAPDAGWITVSTPDPISQPVAELPD